MDPNALLPGADVAKYTSVPLERSVSAQSAASRTSHRSVRSGRNSSRAAHRKPSLPSHPSSAASFMTAASDESLTSFPSFSPESPRQNKISYFSSSPDPIPRSTDAPATGGLEVDGLTDGRSDVGGEAVPGTVAHVQAKLAQVMGLPKPRTIQKTHARPKQGILDVMSPPQDSATPTSQPQARTSSVSSLMDTFVDRSSDGRGRASLFEDDAPIRSSHHVPGALHTATDEHISRLVARQGAVALVRQLATDLAHRDSQMAALRRKADDRERALRRIALECGLSSLDLETRLRTLEQEAETKARMAQRSGAEGPKRDQTGKTGMEDLLGDAMGDVVVGNGHGLDSINSGMASLYVDDATIRARNPTLGADAEGSKGTMKAWKDYLWGGGGSKKGSAASSVNGDPKTLVRVMSASDRRPTLQEDLFDPPEAEPIRSASRASSIHSGQSRKPSLASLALRLVAGSSGTATRDHSEARGRADSASGVQAGGSLRTPSASSTKTTASLRAVSTQGGPKSLMAMRRTTAAQSQATAPGSARVQPPERWDTMVSSPTNEAVIRQESYGPVEMDTILPPEAQPPTLTHVYNNRNYGTAEYLTDRFGFIYDQRRKKRQREAAHMARHIKAGSRSEMLTNGRDNRSPLLDDDTAAAAAAAHGNGEDAIAGENRPQSPSSMEEVQDEPRPRRWTDYLKIATFPTELLSHTPSIGVPALEVTEGSELPLRSPGIITTDDRGFMPTASGAVAAVDSETAGASTETTKAPQQQAPAATLVTEDAEPVKLLLQQLTEQHDSLQREKTARWNDFLRKVRAERRREGEVAAAAAAAAAEARFQRVEAIMPESRIADGEMVGVAGLGNKGKLGRAKWNEFYSLVLGGIPVAYRAKIWAECSGAAASRVPGYYDDLAACGKALEGDDPQVAAQIKADITRTLTDNIFFRCGPGVEKLNEVLLAYARRNPEVGYCQGMNLVAANLLLITPTAEDAFWILASMIEIILPQGYYDHSLLASRADQQVLRQYVATVLPRLSSHFDDLGIDLETMTFQWFLSVFTDCLSAEALFRVWDVVLCGSVVGGSDSNGNISAGTAAAAGTGTGTGTGAGSGSTFLFQVALALLKLNETQLLACDSPAAVYTYINHQMTNHAISIDGLINASEALKKLVRRDEVETRRAAAVEAEKELMRRSEENKARLRSLKQKKKEAAAAAAGNASGGEASGKAAVGLAGLVSGGGEGDGAGEEPLA